MALFTARLLSGVQSLKQRAEIGCFLYKNCGNQSKIRTSGGKSRVFIITKRQHEVTSEDDDDTTTGDTRKLPYVQFDTFKKWKRDFDKELNTVTWLKCETVMASGKKMVRLLKCSVCSKYRIRIESSRNFSDRWIIGAESLRTSNNIRDHRKNNQHALAMSLLMKERASSCGQGPSSYTPIVQALNTLSDTEKARFKRKFI